MATSERPPVKAWLTKGFPGPPLRARMPTSLEMAEKVSWKEPVKLRPLKGAGRFWLSKLRKRRLLRSNWSVRLAGPSWARAEPAAASRAAADAAIAQAWVREGGIPSPFPRTRREKSITSRAGQSGGRASSHMRTCHGFWRVPAGAADFLFAVMEFLRWALTEAEQREVADGSGHCGSAQIGRVDAVQRVDGVEGGGGQLRVRDGGAQRGGCGDTGPATGADREVHPDAEGGAGDAAGGGHRGAGARGEQGRGDGEPVPEPHPRGGRDHPGSAVLHEGAGGRSRRACRGVGRSGAGCRDDRDGADPRGLADGGGGAVEGGAGGAGARPGIAGAAGSLEAGDAALAGRAAGARPGHSGQGAGAAVQEPGSDHGEAGAVRVQRG